MAEISVVIPVYNAQQYISECLESIIFQTFDDLEIVCVNDGSTDESSKIISDYAKKDSRVRLINQKNSGASAARNTGIECSFSPYLAFVDADDIIAHDAFEKMYFSLTKNEADYVFCRMLQFDSLTRAVLDISQFDFSSIIKTDCFNEESMPDFLYTTLSESACDKMFRRSFLLQNNLYFLENIIFEDIPFFSKLYLAARKIAFVDEKLYKYRQHHGSSITQTGGRNYFDIFKAFELRRKVFNKYNKWEKYKSVILLSEIKLLFLCLVRLNKEFRSDFINEIKKRYYYENLSDYDSEKITTDPDFSCFVRLLNCKNN